MNEETALSTTQPEALATRLASSLRARRSYLLIYQQYRRARPKEDFAELLDLMIDDTQYAIARLSSLLRRLDRSPMQSGVNETLLGQGMSRKGTPSKLNFMLVGCGNTLEWYAAQQAHEDPPEVAELWPELAEIETGHQRRIKGFLSQVEKQAEQDRGRQDG